MNCIAITQHVRIGAYDEQYDAVDQRWNQLILDLGFIPIHLPNLPPEHVSTFLSLLQPKGIVFTGGNSLYTSPMRDRFELALLKESISNSIPVLGVCRGMQLINIFYSGTISRVTEHANTNHQIIFENSLIKFDKRHVKSYHEWGIKLTDLGVGLEVLATSSDETIEAIKHVKDNVMGIMWHPEREKTLNDCDKFIFERIFK